MFSYIASRVLLAILAIISGILTCKEVIVLSGNPLLGSVTSVIVTISSGFLYRGLLDAFWPYSRWAKVILDEITLGKCTVFKETRYVLESYAHLGFRFTVNRDNFDVIQIGRLAPSATCFEHIETTLPVLDAIRIKRKLNVSAGDSATFRKALSQYEITE